MLNFFSKPAGKVVAAVIVLVGLALAFYSIKSTFGQPDVIASMSDRMFVCSETGKSFNYHLRAGDHVPVESPYSGKATGYPAEMCFWTKDGHIKSDATYVLVNEYVGKAGPTFCPDCGRLVVAFNPRPGPNDRPPPTESEWKARHQ